MKLVAYSHVRMHETTEPLSCSRSLSGLGNRERKAAERGQILTISPAHSGPMGQESGEIWTAETLL